MNFDTIFDTAVGLSHQYPIVVALVAIAVLFLLYKGIKGSFKFLILLLVLAAFFYAITLFQGTLSTGINNSNEMNSKTQRALE